MKKNPELYSKYANVKTPMGFTFDQAIQVSISEKKLINEGFLAEDVSFILRPG